MEHPRAGIGIVLAVLHCSLLLGCHRGPSRREIEAETPLIRGQNVSVTMQIRIARSLRYRCRKTSASAPPRSSSGSASTSALPILRRRGKVGLNRLATRAWLV